MITDNYYYFLEGDPRRRGFVAKMEEYLEKLVQDHAVGLMDEVMDQVATENIHSSLPPFLSDGLYHPSDYVW